MCCHSPIPQFRGPSVGKANVRGLQRRECLSPAPRGPLDASLRVMRASKIQAQSGSPEAHLWHVIVGWRSISGLLMSWAESWVALPNAELPRYILRIQELSEVHSWRPPRLKRIICTDYRNSGCGISRKVFLAATMLPSLEPRDLASLGTHSSYCNISPTEALFPCRFAIKTAPSSHASTSKYLSKS